MDRNDSEQLVLRTKMPYHVTVSLVNDNWRGVNRDYRSMTDNWFYNPMAGMNYTYVEPFHLSPKSTIELGEKAVSFYLYNDGCKPWDGAIHRRRYYERYNNIQKLETRLILMKKDQFIIKQLKEI